MDFHQIERACRIVPGLRRNQEFWKEYSPGDVEVGQEVVVYRQTYGNFSPISWLRGKVLDTKATRNVRSVGTVSALELELTAKGSISWKQEVTETSFHRKHKTPYRGIGYIVNLTGQSGTNTQRQV